MGITEFLAGYITQFIDATGYVSVFVLMTMESMIFPVPSEAVMPFAGFLIEKGRFTFPLTIFYSTLGSIVGSLLSYAIGRYGGKPFVRHYGRWFLLNEKDLELTERFFARRGDPAILICRFIPVVRHLISLPAGTGRMNLVKFSIFTIIGAGLWNAFLAVCGFYLKQRWETVMKYSGIVDLVVLVGLAALVFLFIYRHLRRGKVGSAQP